MPTPEPWDGNICSNKRCVNLFEMEEKITQLENGLYSAQLMVDGTALSMSVANSKKKAQMELASKVLEEKLLDKYCKENSHVD